MPTPINETSKRKYLRTYDSTITLKERVFIKLAKYPNISPKELCRLLDKNYAKYGDTVKTYKWQYKKSKSQIGLHSKSPKSHKARAICRALKSMNRGSALEVGWFQTKNRNRCLIFKDRNYGRIEWWESGTILVSIKKPQTMARVKTFLCKAFFETGLIQSSKILSPFFRCCCLERCA